MVRGGLGDGSVGLRYIGHRIWEPTALVADRYHVGRVFLAGDAAHVTMPVGGHGMNCGVADVHNLAWKCLASGTLSLDAGYRLSPRGKSYLNYPGQRTVAEIRASRQGVGPAG